MSLATFGGIMNLLGVFVGAMISAAVLRWYKTQYFQPWTWAYVIICVTVLIEAVYGSEINRPVVIMMISASTATLAGSLWLQTGLSLENKKLPRVFYWITPTTAALLAFVLHRLVHTWDKVAIPFILYFVCIEVWLGFRFLRKKYNVQMPNLRYLGITEIATSSFGITYPLVANSNYFWLAASIQGILHLINCLMMIAVVFSGTVNEIRLKNQDLLKLDKLKSGFIRALSHELRTPLSVILGTTPLLLDKVKRLNESDFDRALNMIDKNAKRLATLIFNTMDYAQMESGTLVYSLRVQDLSGMVSNTVKIFKDTLFDPNEQELTLDLPADKPVLVPFDLDQLSQALGHLLSNASKFSSRGGKVVVRLRELTDVVQLEVIDDGIGISKDNIDDIFTRFYQVDIEVSRKFGGTGLGLAIAKSIVETGHKGRLYVESELNKGSRFVMELPKGTAA